jgi:hypothetical protein
MKLLVVTILLAAVARLDAALPDALHALASVGREGRGNEAAGVAWKEVVAAGPSVLPTLLAATGHGSPVADNWLRLAGDAIVETALRANNPLPLEALEAFLHDTAHADAARQLAFDLLREADATRADAIEPTLLNDPVQELRRGAVQRLIKSAKSKDGEEAKALYLQALDVVRDEDQTQIVVNKLKNLGVAVDLPRHFGFLMKWNVIGPFDNTGRKGFDATFPPEKEVKLNATYEGRSGPVKWQPVESRDDYGKLDLNKPLGMLKEVTGYATTTFDSPEARDAELRLGCKNAWKVWLNGELLLGRDEYHRGQKMDQYKLKCRLKRGPNIVLVKCCQDEEKEEWTVEWEFQLRLCDRAGSAILADAAK